MALGEALARCPELVLVPADPLGVAEAWEQMVAALEGIGAAVEPARAGLAYFEADGLRGLHGGSAGLIAAARRAVRPSLGGRSAHVGAGPTRFCALAAALAASSRRPLVAEGDTASERWLGSRRSSCCAFARRPRRWSSRSSASACARWGSSRSCRALRLPTASASPACSRTGWPAVRTRRCARASSRIAWRRSMEVGDASSGPVLERVLGVLVDRLLARPGRRGRTLRAVTLSARLRRGRGPGASGSCSARRSPIRERMRLALSLRLALLPAPAEALRLGVERFGPPAGEQRRAARAGSQRSRTQRLREAVAQVRAVAGPEAALRAALRGSATRACPSAGSCSRRSRQ